MKHFLLPAMLCLGLLGSPCVARAATDSISAGDYPSIQAAIDAHPGGTIQVPAGDYELTHTLTITADHTALEGSGRLIQTNREDSVSRIEGASFVRVAGLTLTRPAKNPETTQEGISVRNSRLVDLADLSIIDNRGPAGSIRVMESTDTTVRDCLIYNYMFVTVEDRTHPGGQGIAFKAIDGTGIVVVNSPGLLLEGNRVIEENLLATPAVRKKYDLGRVIKRSPLTSSTLSESDWKQDFVQSNWHQGSGIYVGLSSGRVIGNHVRNAAQGMDIHSDQVIIANNIIENSHMGMKAMHGARNVVINGNQFLQPALWGICLASGSNAHPASAARGSQPAVEANLTGGAIISNNVIADFGYGRAAWNWQTHGNRAAIFIASDTTAPIHDVVIMGNMVYDPGRDSMLVNGTPQVVPPRYLYALKIEGPTPPGLRVTGNCFNPGSQGICNIPLPE
jgi:hypothetical protein